MAYGVVTGQVSDFPIGGIIIWSGAQTAIPSGWHLCDGTSGTPDLRNRFIVGAGSEYKVGDTGGSKQVTLTVEQLAEHKHDSNLYTSSAGSHSHTINNYNVGGGSKYTDNFVTSSNNGTFDEITTDTAGSHSHSINGTLSPAGGSQPHENRPPYYALCYIMKIK